MCDFTDWNTNDDIPNGQRIATHIKLVRRAGVAGFTSIFVRNNNAGRTISAALCECNINAEPEIARELRGISQRDCARQHAIDVDSLWIRWKRFRMLAQQHVANKRKQTSNPQRVNIYGVL